MIVSKNPVDNCFLVSMDGRARCCGECNEWLKPGELVWSYTASPVDGNYVECDACRYGEGSGAFDAALRRRAVE
jgi:hypothetical protein